MDYRWQLCRRPTVIVGGELTLETLDLVYSDTARFYEAPFQVKATAACCSSTTSAARRSTPPTC
jgi:hypothetical protein